MNPIKIATAQFENKSGDKAYNLSVMDELARKAALEGIEVLSFHECSITGYTFASKLNKEEFLVVAESIPDGESIQALISIAKKYKIILLAGLFDKDKDKEESSKNLEWYNYKIPWDLRLAYSVTYNNTNRQDEIASHSLMASGNFELAPRWKVGFSSGYDFKQKGVTFTQLRFERDLESWRMSFNWVPFGQNTYWGFFIGISSSIFSDIKYEKRQLPDRVFR